jgi:hypothetical protein
MIKFEYNMLVLNNAFSEDDVDQINAFADYVRSQERERIIALLEDQLWRTPDGEVIEDFELNGHTPFLIELIRGQ